MTSLILEFFARIARWLSVKRQRVIIAKADNACVFSRLRVGPNNFPKCARCGLPEIDHVAPVGETRS